MTNHYEINISLNGKHLFATHPRSLTTEKEYNTTLAVLQEKFLQTDGYLITASKVEVIGKKLEIKQP
jgi:hypothetical protein